MPESSTQIATDNPQRLITRLSNHWAHKFPVTRGEGRSEISLSLGLCRLEAGDTLLRVQLVATEENALRQLETVVASHLQRMAAEPLPEFIWNPSHPDSTRSNP